MCTGRHNEIRIHYDSSHLRTSPLQPPSKSDYLIILLVFVACIAGFASLKWLDAHNSLPFEKGGWLTGSSVSKARMARWLCEKNTLLGMDVERVSEELGEPDVWLERMIYRLGGDAHLVVTFNSNGLVTRAAGSSFPSRPPERPWDSQKWIEGSERERSELVPHLIGKNSILVDKLRDEVISLLGTADSHPIQLWYTLTVHKSTSGSKYSARPSKVLAITIRGERVEKLEVVDTS